ncbi:MAG: cytosine deaminase [Oceanospirillaceae bacterium]|uniref:cytosine deaminase n=1 Tax=unclassified Thalassolituus TaxID=2624967 RepID=UPI000C09175A|nr:MULTISPECIES: cytosine deaminase [unclassified Thalassolituus]MAK89735.1 cytosine deaminase [Thalassolituus sp.]MAS25094.1 cytosine deaminase [Oceanospirillaceae bacterium]MAX99952.1 cytosine deaminase [Oceanospirillaceae bacterium]MBL36139.1 cytosine deaminase [Oceanospirillaceae bacterium]MBS53089.1 cytosine deaminase [Oceanospirillaceae bacterium]|tara:strand:- start:3373 stop:4641 length:1269 start_codon:yes stop_codon:yes gene_type:complete
MKIINARLRAKSELYTVTIADGKFTAIDQQSAAIPSAAADDIDAGGNLLCAPFVEPHIHLDAALTAGEPAWNQSGTLFEGIERWGQRKPMLSEEDIRSRAMATIELLVQNGVQAIRTHADTTDASLIGVKTLCAIRDELKDKITIQVVAFPQDGMMASAEATRQMEEALEIGCDVVGGIPHFEYTRELGEQSVKHLLALARKYDRLVDVHCDEIDDPNSRFLEVLACEAMFHGMGERVTASHTTAMHSYDNAYCSKLFRLLKNSGINFVSCPTESIHLQGRFDTYPKRRGVTRVKELREAGMNVCLGEDSIFDPWYSLGNGRLLRTLDFAMHICQMMGYQDFATALDLITDNSARTLCLEDYGITVGNSASFILLDGEDDYSVLRKQGDVLLSVRNGEVIMQRRPAEVLTPSWITTPAFARS